MGASDRFRRTGRWLLACEAQGYESAARMADAGARVLAQLEQGLVTLIGERGARLLMVRALRAASTQYAFLATAQDNPAAEDPWGGPASGMPGLEPDVVCDSLAAVIAEALALLSHFVGVGIVMRQVRRIWPELPRDGEALHEETSHERV